MTIADLKEAIANLPDEGEVEKLKNEADRYALDFYRYMNDKAWALDFVEQKTHTPEEQLEYFKKHYNK